MVVFPNAKINIGLYITERRLDGFHNIETVFIPIPLEDVLEVVPSSDDQDHFSYSGLPIPGDPLDNLLVKALRLMREYCAVPPVSVFLHKVIPMGGGLGGGSSDAAFFLKALQSQFNLDLTDEKLQEIALELGSDCPFFLLNSPAIGKGRGEVLKPLSLDLKGKYLVLLTSAIHVSTKLAFSNIEPKPAPFELAKLTDLPLEKWQDNVKNDFERSVFREYPSLPEAKEQLLAQGAVYASMSGTGATVYGVFSEKPQLSEGVILEL